MMPMNNECVPRPLRAPGTDLWERRAKRTVGQEDARQIRHNLMGFFTVLGEWAANDRRLNAERRP